MELRHITFQRGHVKDEEPWSQTYKREFNSLVKPHSFYTSALAPMLELLHRLETQVKAPPCWVFTGHLSVISCCCDLAVHPEGLDEAFLFNLSYGRLSGGDAPAFVIEDFNKKRVQLETVDEAVQIIIFILREAGVVEAGENDLSAR